MKVGDLLHDNDPRMQPRTLKVVDLGVLTENGWDRVQAEDRQGRRYWIATRRIHSDGKQRRSGFTLEAA